MALNIHCVRLLHMAPVVSDTLLIHTYMYIHMLCKYTYIYYIAFILFVFHFRKLVLCLKFASFFFKLLVGSNLTLVTLAVFFSCNLLSISKLALVKCL